MAGGSGQRYRLSSLKFWVPSSYQIKDTLMLIGDIEPWRVHVKD